VLLEAQDHPGTSPGRERFPDGGCIDLGGQWVGPTQDRFYALIAEMGGETYPTPEFGKSLMLPVGKKEPVQVGSDDAFGFPGADTIQAAFDARRFRGLRHPGRDENLPRCDSGAGPLHWAGTETATV
jgi:monoamine oxidase